MMKLKMVILVFSRQISEEKVVADRLRANNLDLEAERTRLRKEIKPKRIVAADGSVSVQASSLQLL